MLGKKKGQRSQEGKGSNITVIGEKKREGTKRLIGADLVEGLVFLHEKGEGDQTVLGQTQSDFSLGSSRWNIGSERKEAAVDAKRRK